jgi:hypothetical protein
MRRTRGDILNNVKREEEIGYIQKHLEAMNNVKCQKEI